MVTNALRHRTGYSAELKAALWFAEQGYEIYNPSFTQSSVDFIAAKGRDIQRIQVKKAYWLERKSGCRYLQATTRKGSGGNGYQTYTKQDCDQIVIVYNDEMWCIPVEKLEGLQSVVVGRSQEIRRSDPRSFDPSLYKVL